MRSSKIVRNTLETKIEVEINLDGTGKSNISTGLGFFDHMLELFAFHAKFDLTVQAKGDLWIDGHHTIEDIGLAMGQAFKDALGSKEGIERYSFNFLPMDETLVRVALDISNRPLLVYSSSFEFETVGGMETQNVQEFFKSFATEARITLHVANIYSSNDHHQAEAMFKGVGRTLRQAVRVTEEGVSSTKGVL